MAASQLIFTALEDLERVCCREGSINLKGALTFCFTR